jgi:purine-binding chemotaxis protein CheW
MSNEHVANEHNRQLCGFRVGTGFYAISVLDVQEVIKPQLVTKVPSSPTYIQGLINLRGQIVTAISLKSLFGLENSNEKNEEYMNIIVRSGESLYALVVDEILDVIDVDEKTFENTPDTIDEKLRLLISGVYKLDSNLLMLLDLEKTLNIDV